MSDVKYVYSAVFTTLNPKHSKEFEDEFILDFRDDTADPKTIEHIQFLINKKYSFGYNSVLLRYRIIATIKTHYNYFVNYCYKDPFGKKMEERSNVIKLECLITDAASIKRLISAIISIETAVTGVKDHWWNVTIRNFILLKTEEERIPIIH